RDLARYGSSETTDGARPRAVCTSHGPIVGPKRAATAFRSADGGFCPVGIPSSGGVAAGFAPIPHHALVGCAPRGGDQVSCVSRNTPAGLPYPVASLAWSLFSPMPTELSSCVAALICCCTCLAKPSGSSV